MRNESKDFVSNVMSSEYSGKGAGEGGQVSGHMSLFSANIAMRKKQCAERPPQAFGFPGMFWLQSR